MDEIKLYENKQIRSVWDKEKEEWYFSVVDVVGVLTEIENPNNYWKVLKKRLKDEGSELVTYCNQLKMKSHKDGKMYKTDVADMQGISPAPPSARQRRRRSKPPAPGRPTRSFPPQSCCRSVERVFLL